jgi:hypothetical protein
MVTTVTDNSPQAINTSLFSLDKQVQEIKTLTDTFNDKISGINPKANVISVNGKQGIVTLNAQDVHALPDTTVIPTTTGELTNNSGFITIEDVGASYVPLTRKVNNKELDTDITLTASDISGFATVATSGSYNDLEDKPTIRTVKFVDYRWDGTMSVVNQQVQIPLSSFGSEVTPSNVLNFMVIYWTGFQAFASADWADSQGIGLACALIALTTGTGYAKIRCTYFV